MSHHLANQSWDLKKDLTEDDADDEVAVRGRLLGLIELQQEPGELIRHVTSNNAVFSKKTFAGGNLEEKEVPVNR